MGAVSSKAHGRGREARVAVVAVRVVVPVLLRRQASQKAHTAKLAVKSFMQLRRSGFLQRICWGDIFLEMASKRSSGAP